MNNKILSFLIVPALFVAVMFSGCYYDTVISDTTIYSGEDVTFSGDIIPIFNADCNTSGCHDLGGIPPDLSPANAYDALFDGDYINVEDPVQSELYQWVNNNRNTPMPISGTDPNTVSKILSWIDQGALNN